MVETEKLNIYGFLFRVRKHVRAHSRKGLSMNVKFTAHTIKRKQT